MTPTATKPGCGCKKKIIFKMSPELGDGMTAEYCNSAEIVMERVRQWLSEFSDYPGEFSIESLEMCDVELAAIPEV